MVYDKGREIHIFRESEAEDVAATLDEKSLEKAYFRARLDENRKLVLDEETQEQDW